MRTLEILSLGTQGLDNLLLGIRILATTFVIPVLATLPLAPLSPALRLLVILPPAPVTPVLNLLVTLPPAPVNPALNLLVTLPLALRTPAFSCPLARVPPDTRPLGPQSRERW